MIAYHAAPTWLPGGFVGVDIFFVISGFLISGILFEDLDRGTFKFADFIGRRIRRLFPALALILISSLLIGWIVLLSDEYQQLAKHIASGATFVANFVLADEVGYFDNAAETKPMLHLWSLAIEEQFYLFWPLALFFAFSYRLNMKVFILIVLVCSFCINFWLLKTEPANAFFWPFGRVWELLCGAVLAWLNFSRNHFPNGNEVFNSSRTENALLNKCGKVILSSSNFVAITGLVMIVGSVLKIHDQLAFPGIWALAPVTGAILIIAAGSAASINKVFFMSRPMVWLGLISYPLYLWHWPILSFLRIGEGEKPDNTLIIAAILVSIILAWATYYFVEKPVRDSQHKNAHTCALSIVVFAIFLFGMAVYCGKIDNNTGKNSRLNFDFSSFHRDCSEIMEEQKFEFVKRCFSQSKTGNSIAIVGDSYARQLFPGLVERLKETTERVAVFPVSCQSPLIDISSAYKTKSAKLRRVRENGYKFIKSALRFAAQSDSIHTVVLAHNPRCDVQIRDVSDASAIGRKAIYEAGFKRTFELLADAGKNVVVVLDNPNLGFDPRICAYRVIQFSKNRKCSIDEKSHRDNAFVKTYADVALAVSRDFPNVKIVDLAATLCNGETCKILEDGTLLYKDKGHLSLFGSIYVAPSLLQAIR